MPVPDPQEGPGAVAVVAEGAKEPVDLEDDEDDDEEEEAEVAFAVLLEQGKEVAAEVSKQGFQLHLSWLNVWLS